MRQAYIALGLGLMVATTIGCADHDRRVIRRTTDVQTVEPQAAPPPVVEHRSTTVIEKHSEEE